MFRFANPEYLQFLWLVPIWVLIATLMHKRAQRKLKKALGERLTPVLTSSFSPGKRRLKLFLQVMTLTCFVVALARPQLGKSLQTIKSEGIELMLLVDVSNSMLTEDIKPSRLQHAKKELAQLLDLLPSDKVGLVAFAGSAILLSPLTTDKSALKMYLDSMSPETVETQGTDFRKALTEARQAFERGGVDPKEDESVKVTRVVLIASDGEDNEPGGIEEAKKLSGDGTRIFTLAFGTERGGPIPIRDERGYLVGYKRDKSGQNVLSQTKGTILRELASVGKGGFYHATFSGLEIRSLRGDLDRLEKAQFDAKLATNYDERFQIFVLLGLIFAILDLWLGERKPQGKMWRGRFEVAE